MRTRLVHMYRGPHTKASHRALNKVSFLELPVWKWQDPSVSSPSTVVSPGPPVKIGLSDFSLALIVAL
jgi:hypothetical protein